MSDPHSTVSSGPIGGHSDASWMPSPLPTWRLVRSFDSVFEDLHRAALASRH